MESKIEEILKIIKVQIERKSKMYDGINIIDTSNLERDNISVLMGSAIEELGEVAGAIARRRYQLAMDECIDVIHSALLLYIVIEKKKN